MTASQPRIEIHCPVPRCRGRFLAEVEGDYCRAVCPSCGSEIAFQTKDRRLRLTIPPERPILSATS